LRTQNQNLAKLNAEGTTALSKSQRRNPSIEIGPEAQEEEIKK